MPKPLETSWLRRLVDFATILDTGAGPERLLGEAQGPDGTAEGTAEEEGTGERREMSEWPTEGHS